MCGEDLVKELRHTVSHQPKIWLLFSVGWFCQLLSWGFAPGEGQTQPDRPS